MWQRLTYWREARGSLQCNVDVTLYVGLQLLYSGHTDRHLCTSWIERIPCLPEIEDILESYAARVVEAASKARQIEGQKCIKYTSACSDWGKPSISHHWPVSLTHIQFTSSLKSYTRLWSTCIYLEFDVLASESNHKHGRHEKESTANSGYRALKFVKATSVWLPEQLSHNYLCITFDRKMTTRAILKQIFLGRRKNLQNKTTLHSHTKSNHRWTHCQSYVHHAKHHRSTFYCS